MASIYQRGDNFTLQWTVGGKRYRRSLGKISRQQAVTILYAKETELRSGKSVFGGLLEERRTGLFSDFASEYLSWRKGEYPDSQQRIEQIVHDHLIPALGNLPLNEITVRLGEKYKRNRQKKVAIQTVNKELRTLHAVLKKAVEWGEIEKIPIKSVSVLKDSKSSPPKFFTVEELKALYSIDPLHAEIWMLFANTGSLVMLILTLGKRLFAESRYIDAPPPTMCSSLNSSACSRMESMSAENASDATVVEASFIATSIEVRFLPR